VKTESVGSGIGFDLIYEPKFVLGDALEIMSKPQNKKRLT